MNVRFDFVFFDQFDVYCDGFVFFLLYCFYSGEGVVLYVWGGVGGCGREGDEFDVGEGCGGDGWGCEGVLSL